MWPHLVIPLAWNQRELANFLLKICQRPEESLETKFKQWCIEHKNKQTRLQSAKLHHFFAFRSSPPHWTLSHCPPLDSCNPPHYQKRNSTTTTSFPGLQSPDEDEAESLDDNEAMSNCAPWMNWQLSWQRLSIVEWCKFPGRFSWQRKASGWWERRRCSHPWNRTHSAGWGCSACRICILSCRPRRKTPRIPSSCLSGRCMVESDVSVGKFLMGNLSKYEGKMFIVIIQCHFAIRFQNHLCYKNNFSKHELQILPKFKNKLRKKWS